MKDSRAGAARALFVGCHGGVGRAVLAVIERSAPGRRLAERLDTLLLVDRHHVDDPIVPPGATLMPPMTIGTVETLTALVRQHAITTVVDVSSIDTVECTKACDALGVNFLCTSIEEWPGRSTIATDEAILGLLPPRRPVLPNRSHLVGAGANPGIVNALVFAAMEEMAARAGVAATPEALALQSVLITEEDTTHDVANPAGHGEFAMTWSPPHCLEEMYEPRAFAARNGRVVDLGHRPVDAWYRARCGESIIEGMAVPHEEVVTLARRLPSVEIGFLYRIPEAARQVLETLPVTGRDPRTWPTRRLYPPWTTTLAGEDRVGVLLCSRKYGELWMGFRTDVSLGLQYDTNATQLQVAAGVVAGWLQLGNQTGIHFVEDLDWRAFLDDASEVLGPPLIVHDPDAEPAGLAERRVGVAV